MIEGIETVLPLSDWIILVRLKCREYKKAPRGGQAILSIVTGEWIEHERNIPSRPKKAIANKNGNALEMGHLLPPQSCAICL